MEHIKSQEAAMKTPQIAFTTNKHGQRIAYRWSIAAARWFRVGLDAAVLAVATGRARCVPYPVKAGA